ncbi:MAG: ATP-binding protein [Gemmataceae bacterium]|nr:ATP-binding protein [Gemmataceae bacterium]
MCSVSDRKRDDDGSHEKAFRDALYGCDAEEKVRKLFTVQRRGVIFFDDMDLALRDRDKVNETDDQSIFLTALDGIQIKEGMAFVFTTNCPLDLIDRAFKRPGRIDLALNFQPPSAELRRRLIERWHPDLRAGLDVEAAVDSTQGYSFAEIEELRNLLILRYADAGEWDWTWALEQFAENRDDLALRHRRPLGFVIPEMAANGWSEEE